MHGDHLHAGILRAARERGGVDRAVVPAEPHLERHRDCNGPDGGVDQRQGMVEVAHERRAGLSPGHMPGRATHVDVDDVGAAGFRDAGALAHPMRRAPRQLYDVRGKTASLRSQQRIRMALCQVLAGGHFGDHQARPEARDQAPDGRIRHTRHRRQNHRGRQRQLADHDWLTVEKSRKRRHLAFLHTN
jgi:hypothetical protein